MNNVEVEKMLGLIINEKEQEEMVYVLKREMEEILFDLEEPRIDESMKVKMKKRYQTVFNLFQRVASDEKCLNYLPKKTGHL